MSQNIEQKVAKALQKEAGVSHNTALMAVRKFIREQVDSGATRSHALVTVSAAMRDKSPYLLGLARTAGSIAPQAL